MTANLQNQQLKKILKGATKNQITYKESTFTLTVIFNSNNGSQKKVECDLENDKLLNQNFTSSENIFKDQKQNKDTFKTIIIKFTINDPSRNELLKDNLKENDARKF